MQLKKNDQGLEQTNLVIRSLQFAVVGKNNPEARGLFKSSDEAIEYAESISDDNASYKVVQLLDSIGYQRY